MHPLDNVIWRALTTRQRPLGKHHALASKFDDAVSLLGGVAAPTADSYAALATLLAADEQVGVFVDAVVASPALEVVSTAPLLEMVRERDDAPLAAGAAPDFAALTAADVPDMLALTALTKPGPFTPRTREMGDYFGLRVDGALVAMAGERLRIAGYTEISAICTHPDQLGRGHAAALTTFLIRRIVARGERPFLHVRAGNTRAIALYERLGFTRRAEMLYVILRRAS